MGGYKKKPNIFKKYIQILYHGSFGNPMYGQGDRNLVHVREYDIEIGTKLFMWISRLQEKEINILKNEQWKAGVRENWYAPLMVDRLNKKSDTKGEFFILRNSN